MRSGEIFPQNGIKQLHLETQTHRDLPLTQQILLKVGTVKTNTVACRTLPRLLLTALVRRRRCWALCYYEEEDSVGKGVEIDTEASRAGKRKSRKSASCHLKLVWHQTYKNQWLCFHSSFHINLRERTAQVAPDGKSLQVESETGATLVSISYIKRRIHKQ